MIKPLALAIGIGLLGGCTDTFLDLHPGSTPLGVGLEGSYVVRLVRCDPSDVYPAGCDAESTAITSVRGDDPIEVVTVRPDAFTLVGRTVGDASVVVDAIADGEEWTESVAVLVRPVGYSSLTWFDRWDGLGPFADDLSESLLGPVFANTQVELSQGYFSASKAALATMTVVEFPDVHLYGKSAMSLDAGTTEASLLSLPLGDRPPFAAYEERLVLQTGNKLGRGRLSTAVGGELTFDVVDTTAVRALTTRGGAMNGAQVVAPVDVWGGQVLYLTVLPVDASGAVIAGCPDDGPSVADELGLAEISRSSAPDSPFCEYALKPAPAQLWQDTTIIVGWNAAEMRIPVTAN